MGRLIDADKLIELIDDDIASLDKNMSREGYDVCLCTLQMAKQYIKALPTFEPTASTCFGCNCPKIEKLKAEPTKHGRWLIGVGENGKPIGTYCSECGWFWERNIAAIQLNKVFSRIETPRCPNCGARMDEVEE